MVPQIQTREIVYGLLVLSLIGLLAGWTILAASSMFAGLYIVLGDIRAIRSRSAAWENTIRLPYALGIVGFAIVLLLLDLIMWVGILQMVFLMAFAPMVVHTFWMMREHYTPTT